MIYDIQKLKSFMKTIFSAALLEEDTDKEDLAKNTREEILNIARSNLKTHYNADKNVAEYISLISKQGKLIWSVRYAPISNDGFPTKSGHTIFLIDDETGEVLEKIVSPY